MKKKKLRSRGDNIDDEIIIILLFQNSIRIEGIILISF